MTRLATHDSGPTASDYRALYESSQRSLHEMSAAQTQALRGHIKLRGDLVSLLRRFFPQMCLDVEHTAGHAISDFEDDVLLAYLATFVMAATGNGLSGEPLPGLARLRRAVGSLTGTSTAELDLSGLAALIESVNVTSPSVPAAPSPSPTVEERSPRSVAVAVATDDSGVYGPAADGPTSELDLLFEEEADRYGAGDRSSGGVGLSIEDLFDAPIEDPEDDALDDLGALFGDTPGDLPPVRVGPATPAAPPTRLPMVGPAGTGPGGIGPAGTGQAASDAPSGSVPEPAAPSSSPAVKPAAGSPRRAPVRVELFEQGGLSRPATTRRRGASKKARTAAVPADPAAFDAPGLAGVGSGEENEQLDAAMEATIQRPRPVFLCDLVPVAGSGEALAGWEERVRTSSSPVRLIGGPRKRHSQLGSLVIPYAKVNDPKVPLEFQRSLWGRSVDTFKGARIYELGVIIRHYLEDIVSFDVHPDVVTLHLSGGRGLIGVVIATAADLAEGTAGELALVDAVDSLMLERLSAVVILVLQEERKEQAIEAVTRGAALRGWAPSMPVIAACSWEYVNDERTSGTLVLGG